MRCFSLSIFSALTWHKTGNSSSVLSVQSRDTAAILTLRTFQSHSCLWQGLLISCYIRLLKKICFIEYGHLYSFSLLLLQSPSEKLMCRKEGPYGQTRHKPQHESCLHKHQVSDKHAKVISPKTIWCGYSIIPNVCPVLLIQRVPLQAFKDTVE